MENQESIKAAVREKYGELARTGEGSCCSTAGCCGTEGSGPIANISDDYSRIEGYVPEADLGLGCGLPTEAADLKPGQSVLDLGSGAGNDAFIARRAVGEKGEVIGVDMTPEMIRKSRENLAKLGYGNVAFRLGELEALPVESGTMDRVLSNCVLNLVPDKAKAFSEIHRVLRPGGAFGISDVVLEGELPPALRQAAELYVGCVSGALGKSDYLGMLRESGFEGVEVVKEKAINLPEDLLAAYLDAGQRAELERAGVRVLSVTVKGTKPGGKPEAEKAAAPCCIPLAKAPAGKPSGSCC